MRTITTQIMPYGKGLISRATLRFYDEKEQFPTPTNGMGWVDPPLLMIEKIDERPTGLWEDGEEVVLMTPVTAIHLNKKQSEWFKKNFPED